YYFTHQNDRWLLKLYVATVLCFDTVHQALITHTVYTYLVTNFGNPAALNTIPRLILVFQGLTALFVQSFMAVRIWRCASWFMVPFSFCSRRSCTVSKENKCRSFTTWAQVTSLKTLSTAVNALAASGDVLVASILCGILLRSRTGFRRSDTMIKKLILFLVNTTLLTSLFAIASLISITAAPATFIYILFFFCMGRLYSNSLLAILNAREIISSGDDGIWNTNDIPLSFSPPTMATSSFRVQSQTSKRNTM
ncbi:hypothetical protein B0H19DRAFT_1296024, partial [Mycena capillaripes]